MSREFPFINDDAEGMREGNEAFESQFSNSYLEENYIHVWNFSKILALSGSVERHASQEKLWDLSSIRFLGQDGNTQIQ